MNEYGQILSRKLRKALATNSNVSGGFTSKPATLTRPINDGTVDLVGDRVDGPICQRMLVMPYGLGSNNDTMNMRVIAWNLISATISGVQVDLWVPRTLVEVNCTCSASVGVAGSPVLNTERFVDTIAMAGSPVGEAQITAATTNGGTTQFFSPANDTPGFVEFFTRGVAILEFLFNQGGTGTPTMNALLLFQ